MACYKLTARSLSVGGRRGRRGVVLIILTNEDETRIFWPSTR